VAVGQLDADLDAGRQFRRIEADAGNRMSWAANLSN
jgi:hypothetical protein